MKLPIFHALLLPTLLLALLPVPQILANSNSLGARLEALTTTADSAGAQSNAMADAEWAGTDGPHAPRSASGADVWLGLFNPIGQFTLSYAPDRFGVIEGRTIQTIRRGGTGDPVRATPDPGYCFAAWSDGRTDNPRTDTRVASDLSVMAHFGESGFLITNVSNPDYTTSTLRVGSNLYTDRAYVWTRIPSDIKGWACIQTRNDDKNTTRSLTFYLQRQSVVIVALDPRVRPALDWMGGWQKIGEVAMCNEIETVRNLYQKMFPAGWVTLGGNQNPGIAPNWGLSMYSVFAGLRPTAAEDWFLYE